MLTLRYLLMSVILMSACGGDDEPALTRDELLSAESCQRCHPDHYQQWVGSSHAFAADDPVFLAMNGRFQRDTAGQSPTECVRCHAPVALAEGATADGLNLADVAPQLRGVTCYACHLADTANVATHSFVLADDGVLRGGVRKPASTGGAHESAYSDLLDRDVWRSTDLCGVCHDFETRAGVPVHRTYTEWTESLFADTFSRAFLTCGACHMDGTSAPIAVDGPPRRLHAHTLPGVNVALAPWQETETQLAAVRDDLATALITRICLSADLRPEVTIDNAMSGHRWPSGDASTRRAWVELVARKGDTTLYDSGVVPDGTPVTSTVASDPSLWLIRDQLVDADGAETVFGWDAVSLESSTLPSAVTSDPDDPRFYHAVTRSYPPLSDVPDRMTMRVHIRPIGLDIIDELVAGGDLDADVRDRVPTFTLEGTELEWTGTPGSCVPAL